MWRSGSVEELARLVTVLQATAASSADPYLDGFDTEAAGKVSPLSFAGVSGNGQSLLTLFRMAETEALLQTMAATAVQDAGREAVQAGLVARPRIAGYVRVLSPPSCPRCAILAGRFYRWNAGFQRHPRCDCVHQPAAPTDATTDPLAALRAGQIAGLSKADTRAVLDGADLGRVVNARLPTAGGGSRRATMPADIYRAAGDDRDLAIRLLTDGGFIRP